MAEYSVKTYAQNKLNAADSSTELKQLLTDLLYYGNAAYNYVNQTTGNTVIAGVENLGTASKAEPTDADDKCVIKNNEDITEFEAWFSAAGVRFENVNKLYVKLGGSLDNVTLKINGVEVAVSATVYTDGILPTGFDEVYTFELCVDGTLVQTLTYSVNSYAFAKSSDDLALALYRYGQSAVAYQETIS
jgi:hypothetical protein